MYQKKNLASILAVMSAVLILLCLASLMSGRFGITPGDIYDLFAAKLSGNEDTSGGAYAVLFESRIPRIAAALLIGCGLSLSGAAYQGIFRNPMVSPDLLGASAGAGFGAAFGFLLEMPAAGVQLLAFIFGIVSVVITLIISRMAGGKMENSPILMVLSGIVVGALFQAFISIIKYVADPFDTMPSIAFWLMGGLTYVTSSDLVFLTVPVLVRALVLYLMRWKINLLSLGSDEAAALGLSVRKYRGVIIICATLMTASSVAVGGMIGWVGLIIPHFARIFAGPDYRRMMPCTAVLGAGFLLMVDDVARCMFPQELPIGILTAIIGAPVFIMLLTRGYRGFI